MISRCFLDVARGLRYLHSVGLGHLDVKASNVFVTSRGECKLGDFGCSRRLKQVRGTLTTQIYVLPTPPLFEIDPLCLCTGAGLPLLVFRYRRRHLGLPGPGVAVRGQDQLGLRRLLVRRPRLVRHERGRGALRGDPPSRGGLPGGQEIQ